MDHGVRYGTVGRVWLGKTFHQVSGDTGYMSLRTEERGKECGEVEGKA